MNISYDYYRIFYYVAKCGNITQAAKELANNQPNVTRVIKTLEQALGCSLFVRSHNGVRRQAVCPCKNCSGKHSGRGRRTGTQQGASKRNCFHRCKRGCASMPAFTNSEQISPYVPRRSGENIKPFHAAGNLRLAGRVGRHCGCYNSVRQFG